MASAWGSTGPKTTALVPQTSTARRWQRLPGPGRQEPRTCRYELGGHERSREPEGCSDILSSMHRCSQMLPRLCNPRRGQQLLPQPSGNSPAVPAPGPPETSKPPWTQPGVGALPSRCIPPQRASRAPGKDNLEQRGWRELSWGCCTCPLAAACPRLAACVIPRVFFQAPLPSFEWALPAQPRNLPLSGTADERCDKFRKKSLCGSEEKHGSLGNLSCSEAAQLGLISRCLQSRI